MEGFLYFRKYFSYRYLMKFLALLLVFSTFPSFSQTVKGLYVDGFSTILGVEEKEDSLLRFAKNNGFNYLALYQMHIVNANMPLTNVVSAQPFADFVSKAKTLFDISQVGVVSENFDAFNTVYHVYNEQHPNTNEKIDVYNLEFEFWVQASVETGGVYCNDYLTPNGISCDTAGAFSFFRSNLHSIDSLAAIDGAVSEVYFGWFNDGQALQIVGTGVDRILLSAYIPSANYSGSYQYNYLQTRLERLAAANSTIKILPLYSAEADFMHDWSVSNPFFQPYEDFNNALQAESNSWKQFITSEGIQWFAYSDMPKKNMDLGVSEKSLDETIAYPNPSNGKIQLKSNREIEKTELLSIDGTKLQIFENGNQYEIPQQAPGVCFLRVFSSGRETYIKVVFQ